MCYFQYSYTQIIVIFTLFSIFDINLTNAVPAIFVFGDSLLDVGNNNNFMTLAKCNYKPYGIDLGGNPTGRFTNGRTMVDVLGQKLGIKGFIPPYTAPTTVGKVVLKGVNYASGSAGILKYTGKIAIKNINMNDQLDNFANTSQAIKSIIGKSSAQKLLKKDSLFLIGIGSNDFILNYLFPIIAKQYERHIPSQEFIAFMIKKLKRNIKRLYDMDARKFIVADIPPIGCAPSMIDTHTINTTDHCYSRANDIVQMFNNELKKLVFELRSQLKGSAFIYVDVYRIFTDIVKHYKSYGFENADSACCHLLGKHGGVISCTSLSDVCPDRTKYIFWDGYHPTEAVNIIVANRVLNGKAPDVFPMNVRQLKKVRTY